MHKYISFTARAPDPPDPGTVVCNVVTLRIGICALYLHDDPIK
jgi:hypothetical protein